MFSVTVLRDERIVVVAEQRPDSTEEDSFQWMSRVLQVLHLSHCGCISVPDCFFSSRIKTGQRKLSVNQRVSMVTIWHLL